MCSIDIYFWRQFFILLATLLSSISGGFVLSFPGVLNPAITSPNSTDIIATPGEAKWITSSNGFAGIIGFCILPTVMQKFGRRWAQIFLNSMVLVGWITIALAQSVTALYIARMFQGIKVGAFVINVIIIGEYVNPTRRGYFCSLKKSVQSLGVLTCHVLSIFCTWRQLACIAGVASFMGIVIAFFWPESPPFLAMRGQFDECEKSYLWLHGKTTEQSKELRDLIAVQKERLRINQDNTKGMNLKLLLHGFIEKTFIKSASIAVLVLLFVEMCGKHYFVVFIIQIMHELVGDHNEAVYYAIGVDLIMLSALLISCVPIRYLKRRTLLFTSGIVATLLMLSMSLLVFLKSQFNLFTDVKCLIPCIVLLHCFVINVGLIPLCFALIGEIFALEHRGMGTFVSGMSKTVIYAVFLHIVPSIISVVRLEGAYLTFGVVMSICLLMLFFLLPETKDRTLQDIESEMKGTVSSSADVTAPMIS